MEPFIRTGFSKPEGGTLLVRLASRAVVCLLGSLVAGFFPCGRNGKATERGYFLTAVSERPAVRLQTAVRSLTAAIKYLAAKVDQITAVIMAVRPYFGRKNLTVVYRNWSTSP